MKNIKILLSVLFTFAALFAFAQSTETEKDEKEDKNNSDLYIVLITYVDGSTETIKSEFYADEITGKPFLFKNNCERIYADQTKTLVVKNNKDVVEKGISFDNSWYFEEEGVSGNKLKVYNDRPYKQGYNNFYFQKGDGTIIKYCGHTLKEMVGDNPKAKRHAELHAFYRDARAVLAYGGAVAGFGMFFLAGKKDYIRINSNTTVGWQETGLFGGIALGAITYPIFTKLASKSLLKAIKIYNESPSK